MRTAIKASTSSSAHLSTRRGVGTMGEMERRRAQTPCVNTLNLARDCWSTKRVFSFSLSPSFFSFSPPLPPPRSRFSKITAYYIVRLTCRECNDFKRCVNIRHAKSHQSRMNAISDYLRRAWFTRQKFVGAFSLPPLLFQLRWQRYKI